MNMVQDVQIVKTDDGAENGQSKCPNCGSTDISMNPNTGKLRCNFCRTEFEPETAEQLVENIEDLQGEVIASGAKNIDKYAENIITLKCQSCGADVVIDTESSTQARCHWCRSMLSINQQIPNGAVPDTVLPFKLKKQEAQVSIQEFVKKRSFFANPKFKADFTTENIMGVYFPYMLVDANAHVYLAGQGEQETRRYKVDDRTYYDADVFAVRREFDLMVDDLTIESSADKLDYHNADKTTNIINSIMPFDTENCVKWDSNYLRGYTSEKRDTDIDVLKPLVNRQLKGIAKFSVQDTLSDYDRGVRWESEKLELKGRSWTSTYLPVWLYSYMETKSNGNKVLHYVAVNARTKETMGSVPIHIPKLLCVSGIVEAFGGFLTSLDLFEEDAIFLLSGFVFYFIMWLRYRNAGARHTYERETKTSVKNLRKEDRFIKELKRLRSSNIEGRNDSTL